MEFTHLSKTVSIKTISEDKNMGVFEIEGLYTGYGLTLGNSLRRVLLSSLPGAAVTQVKIKNVPHEFSTLPGVIEDMVTLSLNFKQLRFRVHSEEPQLLTLTAKGEKVVTGGDIKLNADVELVSPDQVIAHLTDKNSELQVELKVERGIGYSAVEQRKMSEKLPIGSIAIDAIFAPVSKVHYTVDNMRVGDRTDYDRLHFEIETDGTISPSSALHKAASILKDYFEKVLALEVSDVSSVPTVKEKKSKKSTPKE